METPQITLDSLLGDEDLHEELRALGWNEPVMTTSKPVSGKVTKTSTAKPTKPPAKEAVFAEEDFGVSLLDENFDVDSIANIGLIDESAIQLEEDDLQDPDLLDLYNEMSSDSSFPTPQQNRNSASLPSPNTISPYQAAELPPPKPVRTTSIRTTVVQPEEVTQTANDILNYSNITAEEATRKALEFKRAGETEEALKWFRLSKQLAKVQPQQPPNPPPTSSLKPVANTATKGPPNVPAKPAKPSPALPQRQTNAVPSSSSLKLSEPLTSSGKISSTPKTVLEKDQTSLFEAALLEASNYYLKEAKRLKELNQPKVAVEKMRKYKYYQQELSVLQSRKHMGLVTVPLFSWKTHRIEERIENVDIAENEIRVQIEGLYNIEGLTSSQNHRNIALTVNFGKGSGEKDEVVEVAAVRSEDGKSVDYRFIRSLPILKRSKLSQQLYARKKITVELLMNKGFFRGQYVVAMAVLPLADLLSKCSVGGDLPLYSIDKASDGSNKKGKVIGGVLRMSATIRSPLVTPEVKVTEERELVIEEWPTTVSSPQQSPPPPAATRTTTTAATTSPPSTATTSNTTTTTSDSQSSARLLELEKQLSNKEKADPENIEFIESNDVLEQEIHLLETELGSGRVTDENDVLAKRMQLQMLQAKLQILVYSVQNESLSMEEYLTRVRRCIERDKRLALYQKLLNSPESKTVALRLMKRVKIMENELKNVEESMQEES
mmetsp:Transcript_19748/g.21461  ORF Transcript_19748/g.21461 Transcript_19748/m.21461 type:complete len:720 (+) Transcript_19748:34-2193(+)